MSDHPSPVGVIFLLFLPFFKEFLHFLQVFVCHHLNFLSDLLISSLRTSVIFLRLFLRSYCATDVLGYSGLAVVAYLGSGDNILPWLLLFDIQGLLQ